ncbi:hypothetical protein Tco_0606884 [Tanacetum coccineum]
MKALMLSNSQNLIAESERYPPDEFLHPYEPYQRYQTDINGVSFIEPYECPEPVVLETEVPSDQNGQADQNDHNDQNDQSVQTDEILNNDQSEHSNHTNDEQIIDNILSTKDIQISKHLSSPNVEDTSDKHIELVNIIDFLSEEEPKKTVKLPSQNALFVVLSCLQDNSPANSMVESSKQNKLKKFSFVTDGGEQIHLATEKIEEQKRIEESLKAELAKKKVEKVKNELVDLMGIDVVTHYCNKKLMYDKYCDKMLKRRKSSKITNCDVLTKKGPITLKVYREYGTNEVISNFKISDLYLTE